jgi:fibronectin type 3 domain-containing protein
VNSSPETQPAYADLAVQSGTTYAYTVKSVDANGVESSASNQISLVVP